LVGRVSSDVTTRSVVADVQLGVSLSRVLKVGISTPNQVGISPDELRVVSRPGRAGAMVSVARHFIEPILNLAREFGCTSSGVGPGPSPRSSNVLADFEASCTNNKNVS